MKMPVDVRFHQFRLRILIKVRREFEAFPLADGAQVLGNGEISSALLEPDDAAGGGLKGGVAARTCSEQAGKWKK